MNRKRSYNRRATTYVFVLGSTLLVTASGLAALMSARVSRRGLESLNSFNDARFLAQSAVEITLLDMRRNPDWRSTKPAGTWRNMEPLSRGFFSATVNDDDNNFGNSPNDPVTVTAEGFSGKSRFSISVVLAPEGKPGMTSLESAVHGHDVDVAGQVLGDAPVSANKSVTVRLTGIVDASVEAVLSISILGLLTGTSTTGIAAKQIPGTSVFDYYVANAVMIDINSISGDTMDRALLSPSSNPYGPTHPSGLYAVNCRGRRIRIRDSRIHGSLILLDTGSGSMVENGINWEVYDPNYPALMVRGSFDYRVASDLSETGSGNTNFNPAGSPYEGVSDTDTTDTYPARIKGLVYTSGNLTVSTDMMVEGAVIAGAAVNVSGTLAVAHDSSLALNPPRGFENPNRAMVPSAGSWKQTPN
jgi:hypothetical protein